MYIPLCVLSVCDGVTDDVLQEDLEDTASLLVDEARDTLDTATTSETTDGLSSERVTTCQQDTTTLVLLTGLVIPWMLSRKILR